MDAKMTAALMAEFKPEQIGHKPTVWCKACTDAKKNRQGNCCDRHEYKRCLKCATSITTAHICLEFVGHADVRHRLCEVDPEWTWEPFEFPGVGCLIIDGGAPVGMWITLTIGGVSKPGYGSCDKGKDAGNAVKELIGDAIRNAGQSFGIAWYLWAKGDRDRGAHEQSEDSQPQPSARPAANGNGHAPMGQTARPAPAEQAAAPSRTEVDDDAQKLAVRAGSATTLDALHEVQVEARDTRKLTALITDPEAGTTGGLGQYIAYCKRTLDEANALRETEAVPA